MGPSGLRCYSKAPVSWGRDLNPAPLIHSEVFVLLHLFPYPVTWTVIIPTFGYKAIGFVQSFSIRSESHLCVVSHWASMVKAG